MKVETALTAFCMTTVMLIVGLVALTATRLDITDSPLTGNYVGIPQMGQALRQGIPPAFPEVDAASPSCYQDGIRDCHRLNAGPNFATCSDRVARDCGLPVARLTQCILPAGFELKYLSSRECKYGVLDECKARCSADLVDECVEASKSRCSLIGGRYQDERLQTKYTSYPFIPLR